MADAIARVLVAATAKGGAGKSTTIACLAVHWREAGRRVALLDADPNRTLTRWHAKGSAPTSLHARNFLDCVKSRHTCNCDIEVGHRDTTAALIGNIAHKTKSLLEWDAKAERFTNKPEANRLLSYEYRAPFQLPS